ncbi:MAG: carboxypeptidase regulatory-like domain-containing protein [bacterium]
MLRKKFLPVMTIVATIFWSMGITAFLPLPVQAAMSLAVSTSGLINGNFPGAPISVNSSPIALVKLSVTASQVGQTLTSVTASFSGAGFATSDLASLATNGSSGVALYNDAGPTAGSFDPFDEPIALASEPAPVFTSNAVTLIPATPVSLTNGSAVVFYVTVRTSGTASNDDRIMVTIPSNGVTTTDGNGPSSNFSANEVRVDATSPEIVSVSGSVGSPTLNVRFNRPVQKVGGGSIVFVSTSDPFTYVDGGGSAQTISVISHTAGQDFAILTMSAALSAEDFDGTPATIAAGSNKIAAMSGEAIGTDTVGISSPLGITTPSIPSTTVGTAYTSGSPLVTFVASNGTEPYTWTATSEGDTGLLTTLGLTLTSAGKLTGTIANVPGSYMVGVTVTDSTIGTPKVGNRMFSINIAPSGGGGVPGITGVIPAGGAIGGSSFLVTITGVNTHFSVSSTVQFLSSGSNDTSLVVSGVASSSATNLTFTLAVGGGASAGSRDVRVTTGSETVTIPSGFTVFGGGSSGLTLLAPSDGATSMPLPPFFTFNPSSSGSVNSYRITIKSTSDFSGTALWDYAFPKYVSGNGSHCDPGMCNIGYGAGNFLILTQPAQLAPNTTYYWMVRTYAEQTTSSLGSATALESTPVRGFTTTASVTDTIPPNIMHRPIFRAAESSALNVFARVFDNVATSTTSPALSAKLLYCAGSDCTPTTEVTGTSIGSGYYRYTIPSEAVGAVGSIVRYFLQASDGSNTAMFKGPSNTPFELATVAVGASSIAGTVKDSSNICSTGVRQATVFAEGTSFYTTSSNDSNCTYTLSGLTAGTYDIVAIKDGYGDRQIGGLPAGATGIGFQLSQGFSGGSGGDITKPRVKFNGPMDGMSGIPGGDSNFKIFVVFDKAMSQSAATAIGNLKVNDASTGELVDITSSKGSWAYYSSNPNIPGVPPESNMAVWSFSGTNTFGDNKTIAVVVSSNVTDTAGNSIQGNQPDGSYAFTFTTNSTANFIGFNSTTGGFSGGGTFGAGAFVPPHVKGTTPPPGSFDVPRNTKLVIDFSDVMADDGGIYLLKDYVKLYSVSGITETDVTSLAIDTVTLGSSKLTATVTLKSGFNSGQFAASTSYRLKVLGGAKAANGIAISPPDQASNPMFMSEFKVGTSTDSTAPIVQGSFPDSGATDVPVNIGAINIGFSRDINPSTITSSTFYVSVGSTAINGSVEYRPLERQAFFIPKSALNPNTTYTINITTGAQSLTGVAVATAVSRIFTTGAADSAAPAVSFMNGDDYAIALTFSEPMNAAKVTDSINWPNSVLNPTVYDVIKYGDVGFNPDSAGTIVDISNAQFNYDGSTNTVTIQGLGLAVAVGKDLYLSLDESGDNIAKDLSGNTLPSTGKSARSVIQNSATTKGALGPMAVSDSAFGSGGGFIPTNFSSTTFGFAPPVEVRPFNMMAGQTTIYGVRLPISRQIPSGGTIVLTFPTGFDVSGAKQDINSPMRSDLNGPGSGTVKFKCSSSVNNGKTCAGSANSDDTGTAQGGLADDGIVVNTASRTVTVYLNGATNSDGHDFLTIDIAGIKNSTVPKDFNTSGYTVDVKTKDSSTVVESLSSTPFFIQASGSSSLGGTITATSNNGTGTMKVYLMSPMTGPLETTSANFSGGATASYSFTNLVNGEYYLFTDQTVSTSNADFNGKGSPERVVVNGATTFSFSLSNASTGGTNVTVRISGPANEPLDIFAGSPNGFKVKQVTLDADADNPENFTINLGNGRWFVGVGPQMPKGPAGGPPPAPNYIMPKPVDIQVDGATITESSATANDGILVFTLATTSKTINGVVKDSGNKVMANAEVYAYSPTGGFGTHAQTDTAGAFTLNVADGSYIVGAFLPGMPPSKEVPVMVTSDSSTYLLLDGATTAITPAAAATAFVLKVAKPDYTISGKVTDGTNVIQGASVYAYRTDGPGNANANANSSGSYTLYVSNGTWKVGSFVPQYGQLSEQTVVINGSSASNINFTPTATGTFYSVSGTVTSGGSPASGVFVRVMGNNNFNEAITGVDGTYSVRVPAGNGYIARAFIPSVGELPPLAAFDVANDVSNKDFTVANVRTVAITVSSSVDKMFVDLVSVNGQRSHAEVTNGTVSSLSTQDGGYKVQVGMPGMFLTPGNIAGGDGTTYNSTTGIVTVDGNESLTITLPTLRTVSGTVTDGTNPIRDAWVEMVNPTSGIHIGQKTASNGTVTLKVPNASSAYLVNAMKPGYFREASSFSVNASVIDADLIGQTLTMGAASTTISGQVKIGEAGAASAFVRAEKQGGGYSGTQADANGNYVLPVSSGVWRVFAVAEGYAETPFASNPIDVTGGSVISKNIGLNATFALNPPKSKPITPANGGTLEDLTSGIRLNIPANALGTSTSASNLSAKETNNVRETGSARPVGGKASEIKATDASGNPITNLNDSVTVEKEFTVAELAAVASASDSSINTEAEVNKLTMAYWDESSANWSTLASSITYKDSDGDVVTDPAEDLSGVASVVISAPTDHFSLYAPIVSTDASAPSTPSGLAGSAASSSQITLSWTQVSGATSYDLYRSTSSNGTFSRVGTEPTVSSGSTTSYTDSSLSASTAYYYKITAINSNGESAASSAVSATTSATVVTGGGGGAFITGGQTAGQSGSQQTTVTTTPAVSTPSSVSAAPSSVAELAVEAGFIMDKSAYVSSVSSLTKKIVGKTSVSSSVQNAIEQFVTSGTSTTKVLGAGERAGVVNSYKAVYGKWPSNTDDWLDVVKISNGRWPSVKATTAEKQAEGTFKKIYKRVPSRTNAKDDAAVVVMTYGLRPSQRNLNSEKAAAKSFKAIFGYAPTSANHWDIVRAVAYSGAKR